MHTTSESGPRYLTWAATVTSVAVSAAAGWVALSTATGEIGPSQPDGTPADVEFWKPIGWAMLLAVLPITVVAWTSTRWGIIALASATGVQVIVALTVIGRYAASDFNSGGLEGLIFLLPLTLATVGATTLLITVLSRRHQQHRPRS